MKRFFSFGALTLGMMCLPAPPASAGVHFHFGIDLSFQCDGLHSWCGPGWCGPRRCRPSYLVEFPECEPGWTQLGPPGLPHGPPPGADWRPPKDGAGRPDEARLQWGYPNLNYTHFHPVSYVAPPRQLEPAPAWYPPQYHHPPAYRYPSSYAPQGMTFDR